MLPPEHRLTASESFRRAVRSGRRSGSRTLVVHLAAAGPLGAGAPRSRPTEVGFVVSRAVGNAVRRNRVKRRLRHLMREQLATLPPHSLVVVRALPAASEASYADLGRDLARCVARCMEDGLTRTGTGGRA